jgi:hypothetical protein
MFAMTMEMAVMSETGGETVGAAHRVDLLELVRVTPGGVSSGVPRQLGMAAVLLALFMGFCASLIRVPAKTCGHRARRFIPALIWLDLP